MPKLMLVDWMLPAAMTLPSVWTARVVATWALSYRGVTTRPALPKEGSGPGQDGQDGQDEYEIRVREQVSGGVLSVATHL